MPDPNNTTLMKHNLILYLLLAFSILSCTPEKVSFNEDKLQAAIDDIEEFKAGIADTYIGTVQAEERDGKQLFDDAKDLLSNGEYDKARDLLGDGAISKSAVDSANIAWATLAGLCKEKKYRKAYDFINDKNNHGNLLVAMPHSTPRFRMISEVFCPLMFEYKDRDTALEEYLDLVKLEYYMEQSTILLNQDHDYIPEVYPNVIAELGGVLAASGKPEEALDLLQEYSDAIQSITGDYMYGRCLGTSYIVHIMSIVGDDEEIPQIVDILKKEILEVVPDNSEGQQDFYMNYANSLLY